MWFEVNKVYKNYLSEDRCDGAVVAVLLYAVRFGYNIKLGCPISEILYYHITRHIIPQLCSADKKCNNIKVFPSKLLPPYENTEKAVGMGISLGVDSLSTLQEYNYMDMPDSYKVTHLTYHEVGAHHGMDGKNVSPYSSKELFEGQLERVKEFCKKYNYPLVVINSNMQEFLRGAFPRMSFHTNCSYRNTSAILILQKLFGKFYCASAFNLDEFICDSSKDSEKYEKFLLPYLSTDNIKFYNSNKDWKRINKVELLSDFELSYDYLTVCLTHIRNCGTCMKCKRTLLNLDLVNSLDNYKNSFDIENYKKIHRDKYLKELWLRNHNDSFMKEMLDYALNKDFEYLPQPELHLLNEKTKGEVNKINIRKYPSTKAKILKPSMVGEVEIKGRYYEWYAVITEDGTEGYCYADYVTLKDN